MAIHENEAANDSRVFLHRTIRVLTVTCFLELMRLVTA